MAATVLLTIAGLVLKPFQVIQPAGQAPPGPTSVYATPSGAVTASPSPTASATPPQVTAATSKLLFTGNTFWGRYVNDWSQASGQGTAFPFARLDQLGRAGYDAWIGGLECPTVAGLDLSSAQQEATLSFNCPPEYLAQAARYFTAFTLANNHTDNQGVEGFAATRASLEAAGIQHFGHYDPTLKDELCNVVVVPAQVKLDHGTAVVGELPLVMCGFHGVFQVPPAASVAQMAQYAEFLPVIALPHMGAEYLAKPDQIKTTAYRAMIDAGADIVLGDHPHWVQTTEAYQGKLIVYSMGNFMFDQQMGPERTRSAAIQVTATTSPGLDSATLQGWLDLADDCRGNLPGCMEKARAQGLGRLDLDYQFGVVGTDDSDHQTHAATPEQTAAILDRLQWDATMAALGGPN